MSAFDNPLPYEIWYRGDQLTAKCMHLIDAICFASQRQFSTVEDTDKNLTVYEQPTSTPLTAEQALEVQRAYLARAYK